MHKPKRTTRQPSASGDAPRKRATPEPASTRPDRKRPLSRKPPESPKQIDSIADFERAVAPRSPKDSHYYLRLYVTGSTPRSAAAIANIRRLCEEYLHGRYDLEVVDIYQQPNSAFGEQIIAAPTLIKRLPTPLRKVVGDLSNENRLLISLDIQPHASGD